MSADLPKPEDVMLQQLAEVTRAAQAFKQNRNGMALLAADLARRPMLEEALANFNRTLSVLTPATREIASCRDLVAKALRKRCGFRA